jgi:hypothetical protein
MTTMNIRNISALACLLSGVVMALPAVADAASLRVRCEKRVNPARSSISVDGRNVNPNALYTARVISGPNQKTAKPESAVGDEVEFDFDSNRNDIAQGATPIGANFIRGGTVRAALFNASGQMVAGPTTVACRVR